MPVAVGVLLWLVGAVLFTLSARESIKANPGGRIPQFFGAPEHDPGKVYALRAAGMALLAFSAFLFSSALGYWSVVLILIGAAPAIVLTARHNRQVAGLKAVCS